MKNIILPNIYVTEKIEPLIFLAGPIKGAPDWQGDAISIITNLTRSFQKPIYIASPRKTVKRNLENQVLHGIDRQDLRQREWEWYHQKMASKNGAILFWFPKKEQDTGEKSYALITSDEFGYWMGKREDDKSIKIAIGTDGRFHQWSIFDYDIKFTNPDITYRDGLEETCLQAVNLIVKPEYNANLRKRLL